MKSVISASKRTDIPAFYLPWLVGRVEAGWVDVRNPLFPHKVSHVSLRPDDVAWIVFWSKNYAVFRRLAGHFAAYRLYFQFTVNPPSAVLEPDVPPTAAALDQMAWLAARYGGERVAWRCDPIVVWREGGRERTNYDPDWFAAVCREAGVLGVRRCFTSFAHGYAKFHRRLAALDPSLRLVDPPAEQKQAWARELRAIAAAHGLTLYACAQPDLEPVLPRGACVDGALLGALGGEPVSRARASDAAVAARAACACTRMVDIGDYEEQSCAYTCLYCYALPDDRATIERVRAARRPVDV
jgi:hypothetical protein